MFFVSFCSPKPCFLQNCWVHQAICPGPQSALLQFMDTCAGLTFSSAYIADLTEAHPLLDSYPGVVYLYLDDYTPYHRLGPFRSSPVFFRADVPWKDLGTELTLQGFRIERAFLQRYSDSVFFFFGFDPLGNVVFSMLAYWEIDKIHTALADGAFTLCGPSDADRYGPYPCRLSGISSLPPRKIAPMDAWITALSTVYAFYKSSLKMEI